MKGMVYLFVEIGELYVDLIVSGMQYLLYWVVFGRDGFF